MEDTRQAYVAPGDSAENAQAQPSVQQAAPQQPVQPQQAAPQMNAAQPQMTAPQQPSAQYAQPAMGSVQYAQPQAGGFYQYVPGAGFVQVQPMQQPTQQPAQQPAPTMQAAQTFQPDLNAQAAPETAQAKVDQNKLGQMYGVMTDIMNGEADPEKIMSLFQDTDGDFWKGAIVGAAVGFLASNESVRGAVAGVVGSMLGGEKDPEGPQVTVPTDTEKDS
ncbi:hypothetical protein [Desulfovibrio sp. JC022]|uniref:hypothetical protein n=1 Tax=Desulfovibrio sp. JC022 TaxID=2593642 RepID=UPI0013D0E26C|nr:hypothetical protein [Desulfovibrio sp. JC022]NDV24865.1 hypothetical protein [Desulfovibrio sp. JC022]